MVDKIIEIIRKESQDDDSCRFEDVEECLLTDAGYSELDQAIAAGLITVSIPRRRIWLTPLAARLGRTR